jgi:hypothetical protein
MNLHKYQIYAREKLVPQHQRVILPSAVLSCNYRSDYRA